MLEQLYDHLIAGDTAALARLFTGPPAIDTPRLGLVAGVEGLSAFAREESEWLSLRRASAVCHRIIVDDDQVAAEFILSLGTSPERINLPVAVIGQRHGAGLGHLRIYHSTWPLNGSHAARLPPSGQGERPKSRK